MTTAVLTTVAVDTLTETERDVGDILDAELGGTLLSEDAAALEDDNDTDETGVAGCGGFEPPKNGVGTTVEFGFGAGIPDGYESAKMSS